MRKLFCTAMVLGGIAACTSSPAGIGGNGSGGAADCSPYTDVPAAADVLVRIVNNRSTDVYLDLECQIAFDIEVGGTLRRGTDSRTIGTCFALQSKPAPCCDCATLGVAIAPGTAWETHWDGLFYDVTSAMPLACYATAPGSPALGECTQPVAAQPGPMTLEPRVFATSHYAASSPQVDDPIPVSKDFVLGTDTVVEVVVE